MPTSKRRKKPRLPLSSKSQTFASAEPVLEMSQMESATVAYFDNLSAEDAQEASDWGRRCEACLSQLEE